MTGRVLIGVLLLTLAVAGCGGSSHASAPAAGPARVEIKGFTYHEVTTVISAGDAITFRNADRAAHTVTPDRGGFADSGTLERGAMKHITFSRAGTYPYHCAFHPFMHGTVVVR